MKGIILLLVLPVLFFTGRISASEDDSELLKRYPDVKVSRIISVYDGDTFVCDIDELSPIAGKKIRIRLKHINTPELKDSDPEKSRLAFIEKERLASLLSSAKVIEMRNVGRCKYFRILADVYIDGKDILPRLNQEYVIPKHKITRTNISADTNSSKNTGKTYSKQSLGE